MKHIHGFLAAVVASMLVVAVGVMGEEIEIKKELKILVDGDAEALELDLGDMEIGETRQILTESGKEVQVTRTEKGHTLEVDGKAIEIGGPGHPMMFQSHGTGDRKVIVKHIESGDEKGFHFITREGEVVEGDLDEGFEWVEGSGNGQAMQFLSLGNYGEHAAKTLEASGVLDDLDDAKRQEILDTLRDIGPHAGHSEHQVVVIGVDDDES